MYRYRSPIVNLREHAILKEPRLTQSIIKAWVSRMIDAGWNLSFNNEHMFTHADEPVSINHALAWTLCNVYWRTLKIPTPYNVAKTASLPLVRIDIEAKPFT